MVFTKNLAALWRQHVPGQVIIQLTERCNGRCPQCGMRASEAYERATLGTDRVKAIIEAAAQQGAQALSFTGGEPFLVLDELLELIRFAGECGIPYIRTGTNGFMFASPDAPGFADRAAILADKLAATPLRNFWISIDSAVPETHEEMRGFPGVIRGLEKALPLFHERGLYPAANLGMNRNVGGAKTANLARRPGQSEADYLTEFYEALSDSMADFYEMVTGLGFTMANTCYPMSVEPGGGSVLSAVYAATAGEEIVRFTRGEKATLFKALFDVIPRYRDKLRIFSPLCSLYALYRQYTEGKEAARPCRGGVDFFFVDARAGDAYPCGYRGNDNLGPFEELDPASLDAGPDCRLCDWECFRDPSELFGPLMEGLRNPVGAWLRLRSNRSYYDSWKSDLFYYRACDFFDGRKPPRYEAMTRFARRPA